MRIDAQKKEVYAEIPLTAHQSKIRIKERSSVWEYGLPFASRSRNFHQHCYVEWQIGYEYRDDANNPPSLPGVVFANNKGEKKPLYELSESLYYLRAWDLISGAEIKSLSRFLNELKDGELIDAHPGCLINRTDPVQQDINGVRFSRTLLEYPQLVYQFGSYEIIAEITVREKQRAGGVQPMLYFCFPVSELRVRGGALFGRTAEQNETADFVFGAKNSAAVLEMIKIFGMLSRPHNDDIVAILDAVKRNV